MQTALLHCGSAATLGSNSRHIEYVLVTLTTRPPRPLLRLGNSSHNFEYSSMTTRLSKMLVLFILAFIVILSFLYFFFTKADCDLTLYFYDYKNDAKRAAFSASYTGSKHALHKFGKPTDPKDHRMPTDRCARLMAVAIAHKLDEAWICQQPNLLFFYLVQYAPTFFRKVLIGKFYTPERAEKLREGRW
ncbi:hypothetical protein TNCV_2478131 [Trichonephila clavipes]|nr:hypothetical protein TNCV_2478131 [Trichonephila clavipes]